MWLLTLAAALAAPPGLERSLEAPPLDAVVLVEQGSTSCAGAVVSPDGLVVTAYHCVAAGGRPLLRTRGGRRVVGRVRAVDRAADLALVEAPELAGAPWIPVADHAPSPGEPVAALGHPYGARLPLGFMQGTLRWSVSRGVVSAVGPVALQFDAAVNPGNSGGPLVDSQGRLVGVVSRKTAGGEGLGFGARPEHVQALRAAGGGLPPIGGTWSLHLAATSLESRGGLATLGPRAEVAVRDRVVLGGAWNLPPSARWDAVRFGEVRWLGPELRVGLRQRLFRGQWTTRLDLFGGVAGRVTLSGTVDDGRVELSRALERVVLGGASLRVGNAGFELALTEQGELRGAVVLAWPGVLGVF